MGERKPVTAETVAAFAAENAGQVEEPQRAADYAEALEPILQAMDALRKLPLKEVEPAVVFKPVEVRRDD